MMSVSCLPPAAYVSVLRSTVLEGGEHFGEQYCEKFEQMLSETEGYVESSSPSLTTSLISHSL
jgi:hypothetical protein